MAEKVKELFLEFLLCLQESGEGSALFCVCVCGLCT